MGAISTGYRPQFKGKKKIFRGAYTKFLVEIFMEHV